MAIVKYSVRRDTLNQSTIDYVQEQVFVGDNKYKDDVVFVNNTGADLEVTDGILVKRNVANVGQVLPAATDGSDLADIIGVLKMNGSQMLADTETIGASYCYKGKLDSGLIDYPGVTTINTVVGNKILFDVFTGLGFEPKEITDVSLYGN